MTYKDAGISLESTYLPILDEISHPMANSRTTRGYFLIAITLIKHIFIEIILVKQHLL